MVKLKFQTILYEALYGELNNQGGSYGGIDEMQEYAPKSPPVHPYSQPEFGIVQLLY